MAIDAPTYLVEVQWTAGVWTTIPNLRAASIRRGRQDELGQVQAGTATLLLDNTAGNLSPDNGAGSWSPNVLPLKPIRLSATYNSTQYWLFTGYIQSYEPVDFTELSADMRLVCVDWFVFANLTKLTTTYAAQVEGVRIAAVVASVGARGSASSIDTGEEALLAATLTNANALSHLQDVINAERGLFFVAADGKLTFHNRYHRQTATRGKTSQGTFNQSQAAGALNYVDMVYTLEDKDIYNDIRITASGTAEAEQVASDSTSQTAYGTRTYQLSSPVMATNQALSLAQWLLASYKAPYARMRSITVDGDAGAAHWPHVLGREIGDRITIAKNLPGVLGINRDFWIEQVSHTIAADKRGHTVTWQLSDARSIGTFVLDSATLGILDTNVLVY